MYPTGGLKFGFGRDVPPRGVAAEFESRFVQIPIFQKKWRIHIPTGSIFGQILSKITRFFPSFSISVARLKSGNILKNRLIHIPNLAFYTEPFIPRGWFCYPCGRHVPIGVFCTDNPAPRYTVISPGYKIPGYFSELSSGKYTAQFKNFTTARMHRHMYWFQWHFGVIFPSQDTIWSIILFTMYYFTAINIFLSLHYTEILNSIIIPSTPYRTRHARSLSLRATQILRKDKFTTNINLWQFSVLNRSINSTLTDL